MKRSPRRQWIWLGSAAGVLGLALLGTMAFGMIQARRLRAEVERAQQAMDAGRWAAARKDLTDLARRWPHKGDILLRLGRCEEALGQPERALAAWERIPTRDESYPRAAESRAAVLMNHGRYAPAESCLLAALDEAPPADRYPLLRGFARLLRLEGRYAEVGEALTAAWASAPDPGALLEDLWQSDTDAAPVDAWKVFLDSADPRDDRVWLGRARHAIVIGQLGEAEAWLKRCQARRPDDPAIWRARLDLAMATGDGDGAGFWEALRRLPADAARPEEIAALRAWLADRGGDPIARRRETARLVELQPLQTRALEHLIELARGAGDTEEVARLQRRKAEVDRAKDWIHKLVVRLIPFRDHPGELADLMETLGRSFDHHAWSLVAASSPTDRATPASGVANRPRGRDLDVSRSRAICRAMADAALARLLRDAGNSHPSKADTLADRLRDLRGARLADRTAAPALHDSDRATLEPSPATTPARFTDDAETAGLRFVFDNGRTSQRLLPETMSGGVALFDYDGDGWLDVYCVQGGSMGPQSGEGTQPIRSGDGAPSYKKGSIRPRPGAETAPPRPGDRLFRNRGDGTFEDASARTRIAAIARDLEYGMGVAVGDYDNDGRSDLFLTRLNGYVLLRNRGDGTFEDVTERSGLAGPRENPTSAAFADLDNDGDLDLYVCHYIRWDPDHPATCRDDRWGSFYCDPARYERAADHVFRNDGGRFVDVTERAGFTDVNGRGLGVVAADLDDDNRIDLYVANDGSANFLFRNLGGFRFEETALTAGVAASAEGGYQAGMGVMAADLDGDGRLDLMVTNLYGEGTTLHQNLGRCVFADRSAASGILAATRYLLGFGIASLDATNDGRPDVVITNGNVNDFRPLYPFAMPTRLYEGRPGGRLVDVSDRSGPPWSVPRLGRGLASGDLDNDGRVDFLVMAQDGPLAWFHNRTERPGHFVTFLLEGTRSNRDGVGARVVVETKRERRVAHRVGGGSYLAACDGRIHLGLGASTSVDAVEVLWPSGRRDRWTGLAADAGYRLREGDRSARPLPGFGVSERRRRIP
jgi:tetratricopeptide (TPR) repeat protein